MVTVASRFCSSIETGLPIAPNDGDVLPAEGEAIVIQKLNAGLGGARGEASAFPGEDHSLRTRCHTVDILFRKQRVTGS